MFTRSSRSGSTHHTMKQGSVASILSPIVLNTLFFRNIWKIFLDKGQYEKAKKYCVVSPHVM